jgi:Rab3 GTPase-activating protein non-catalytic subunit
MEIVVFAYNNLLAILSSRWNNEKQHNIFCISTKQRLENPNELITSVLVIPISGQQHASSVDWTLILVGLDSGVVRFFIDSGKEIHTQCFQNEPVQSIKSQSGKRINEEIHISYGSCIVIVEASHLLPVLISLRQQLKKVVHNNVTDQQPPSSIPCRKWGFSEKNMIVTDNIVVGPQKTCSFDHLLTASLDSFNAKFRNTPPQNSLIMSCGSKPYVGFNYAKEGFVQPVLKDVAKAVASKIM